MKNDEIRFNLNEIPESARMNLVSIVFQEAILYLEQPGIPEKFKKWKEEREEKKKHQQHSQ